jgi:hypothetical protein
LGLAKELDADPTDDLARSEQNECLQEESDHQLKVSHVS